MVTRPTKSERLFRRLCTLRGVDCQRIPTTLSKTADYLVSLPNLSLIAEVKQLESNDRDRRLRVLWGTRNSPPVISPWRRIQSLLDKGYPQIKSSSQSERPAVIVVYNNSGPWNWIDTFTVSSAMFGQYGVVVGLNDSRELQEVRRGYLGDSRTTTTSFRALSAVCVLSDKRDLPLRLDVYHNPYATIRIVPAWLTGLADSQYLHGDPHAQGFTHWAPTRLKV